MALRVCCNMQMFAPQIAVVTALVSVIVATSVLSGG